MRGKQLRTVVVFAACALALVAGAMWLTSRYVSISRIYCVETTFGELPEDDELLVQWLGDQPGVVGRTVHTQRIGTSPVQLQVGFIQVRTMAGEPPFPNLEARCAALGYRDPTGPFVDCKD
jgi:hypothetical protein